MNTYTITLGANTIATISGTEYAYEVYKKTCELGELLGKDVCLQTVCFFKLAQFQKRGIADQLLGRSIDMTHSGILQMAGIFNRIARI